MSSSDSDSAAFLQIVWDSQITNVRVLLSVLPRENLIFFLVMAVYRLFVALSSHSNFLQIIFAVSAFAVLVYDAIISFSEYGYFVFL